MSNISFETGLPDIVSVQKRVYPLLITPIVSVQPTSLPIATTYGLKRIADVNDGSGWTQYKFRLDRWYSQVQSIKLKTEITTEAITDMKSLGLSDTFITDNLADQVADDINIDILDKLSKISTPGTGVTISLTDDDYVQARNLYAKIHVDIAALEAETGSTGSYVVCSSRVYGLLLGTGWVYKVEGTNYSLAKSGIVIVNDKYSSSEYYTVGVKKKFGDFELSSLVFSPYRFDEQDGGLSYQLVATDTNSLNKSYGLLSRYAITTAPLENNAAQNQVYEIDWNALTADHLSKLSIKRVVTFS